MTTGKILIEEAQDLATGRLPASLLVVHDSQRRCHDNVTELTRRQQVAGPLLDLAKLQVEAGGNDTTLVDAPYEVDNNFSCTMIIYDFKVTNVLVLLHELEELDDDLNKKGRTKIRTNQRQQYSRLNESLQLSTNASPLL